MTGTAKSAAAEFYEIYGLRVVPIPTNKPPRRKDMPLRLYYTEKVRCVKWCVLCCVVLGSAMCAC